ISKLTIYFTLIRLVLIPVLVMGILLLFRPDPMVSGISVILSGMPAGVTTSIMADKYGADKELASRIVFMSTLLSIVSAPLLAWLLQQVL
ncbi:MAG: AEC family transporter, partial [Treponema sp.]|nr:AEC family transporter [Treponema sp.]